MNKIKIANPKFCISNQVINEMQSEEKYKDKNVGEVLCACQLANTLLHKITNEEDRELYDDYMNRMRVRLEVRGLLYGNG